MEIPSCVVLFSDVLHSGVLQRLFILIAPRLALSSSQTRDEYTNTSISGTAFTLAKNYSIGAEWMCLRMTSSLSLF